MGTVCRACHLLPSPTPFYLREENPAETVCHRTEGVRGVCRPPKRTPSPGLPERLCAVPGRPPRSTHTGPGQGGESVELHAAEPLGSARLRSADPGCLLLRDAPTAKLFPSRAGGAGRLQPCEKRLVPPSAGNRAHLSKHISTCQRELYRGQLKKALASAGSPGLPGEIKGTRGGGVSSLETGKSC